MDTVTTFYGVDGARHEVGFVEVRIENRGGAGGGLMLCDDWQGHGLRELCLLDRAEAQSQADAVIREYRVDAATSDRPLSRAVAPEEIAQTAAVLA